MTAHVRHEGGSFLADMTTHDWTYADPALTSKGEAQCKQLALDIQNKYAFPKEETLIVVSPLRRTLQSYHHGLSWLAEEGIRVELRAEWQVGHFCLAVLPKPGGMP